MSRQGGEPFSLSLAHKLTDTAGEAVAGPAIAFGIPTPLSVPLSGAPLKNPLEVIPAYDDAPVGVERNGDG